MKYSSYFDFDEDTLLKPGDFVIFSKTEQYQVSATNEDSFLFLKNIGIGGIGEHRNVFKNILDIHTNDDVYKFAQYFYDYEPRGGYWPNAKPGDFNALTKLVKAIFYYTGKGMNGKEIMDYVGKNFTPHKKSEWVPAGNVSIKLTVDAKKLENYIFTDNTKIKSNRVRI